MKLHHSVEQALLVFGDEPFAFEVAIAYEVFAIVGTGFGIIHGYSSEAISFGV